MKDLNIVFIAFWPSFNIFDNEYVNILKTCYNVNICTTLNQPIDLAICSCFYRNNDKQIISQLKCKKLYYSGENDFPDFNLYDYAITQNRFSFGDRHLYIPLWFRGFLTVKDGIMFNDILINGTNDSSLLNRDFCSFVVSNNTVSIPTRTRVFEELSKYKHVASGGMYLNNVGGPVEDKKEFIKNYKFNIASENSIVNGYITEKIIDAFNANTVPIYIGPSDIIEDINKDSFINVSNFKTYQELVDYIKEVDTNNDLYMKYLSADRIKDSTITYYQNKFREFVLYVAETTKKFNHRYGRIGLINANY